MPISALLILKKVKAIGNGAFPEFKEESSFIGGKTSLSLWHIYPMGLFFLAVSSGSMLSLGGC